jgi:hypothetical protein
MRKREPLQAKRRVKAQSILAGERHVRMSFFIPMETHARLQDMKTQRGTSLQELIAEAVDAWLINTGAPFRFKPDGDPE